MEQFLLWYQSVHPIKQWACKIGLVLFGLMLIVVVTRTPSERPHAKRIILNCKEGCGTDPERIITYNQYQDQREQAQRTWFFSERQRIQQELWDERGRQRWCRNHPQDRNCKQ